MYDFVHLLGIWLALSGYMSWIRNSVFLSALLMICLAPRLAVGLSWTYSACHTVQPAGPNDDIRLSEDDDLFIAQIGIDSTPANLGEAAGFFGVGGYCQNFTIVKTILIGANLGSWDYDNPKICQPGNANGSIKVSETNPLIVGESYLVIMRRNNTNHYIPVGLTRGITPLTFSNGTYFTNKEKGPFPNNIPVPSNLDYCG